MDGFLRALTGGADELQAGEDESPLGDLLAGLLGGSGAGNENPLRDALAALLGGGSGGGDNEVAGLAEQAQVTPAVVQAVVALLIGQGSKPKPTKTGATDLAALLDQARSGAELDEATLKSSGLADELTKTTGLDLSSALRVLQKLLPALAKLLNLPGAKPAAKPKPKPRPAAKPKPKPTTAAAKPKPKPTASTAKPKPSASGKPATKPRPRKRDGAVEIDLDAPVTPDS